MSAKRKSADQRDDSLMNKRRGATDAGSALKKPRTLKIPRPYGGEIVLTAFAAAGVDVYLGHVRDWFEQQPQELQLFAEAATDTGARELTRFNLVASSQWEAPPATVEVRYEPPLSKRPQPLPPPIVGDEYAAIAGIERRGVSTFVLHARTDALYDTER